MWCYSFFKFEDHVAVKHKLIAVLLLSKKTRKEQYQIMVLKTRDFDKKIWYDEAILKSDTHIYNTPSCKENLLI